MIRENQTSLHGVTGLTFYHRRGGQRNTLSDLSTPERGGLEIRLTDFMDKAMLTQTVEV